MNGAQIIAQCLLKENVHYVFGYPGAAIAPFYDVLYSCPDIRHILVRQEQNAGHSASGYARASGEVGVCCVTSGPGAVNLISAMATAYMDSIPIVALTGQVRTDLIGRDVFQEADIIGACEPFTKYSYLVKSVQDIPRVIKEAFYIASSGRPGPVLIDMPVDIQQAEFVGEFIYPEKAEIPGYKPMRSGHPLQIKRAAEAIQRAERPIICAGGGIVSAKARKELVAFAEKLDIPVVSTLMGVGIMPTEHRLYCGMLGSHGKKCANKALLESDCVLICGARVGDRAMSAAQQIAERATIIHIDIDTAEIGKNMRADIPIVGDVRLVIKAIMGICEPTVHTAWVEKIIGMKSYSVESSKNDDDIVPSVFMKLLSEETNKRSKAILVADVGQNQIWAANNFEFIGGRFLTSGGMGTMGYSFPAAIGAKLAKPERQVIAVCGDGGYMMLLPEISTAVEEKVPVKLVIMNNNGLGMIRELQNRDYNGHNIALNVGESADFAGAARALGAQTRRITKLGQVRSAISEMLDSKGVFVLECVVSENNCSVSEVLK